MDFNVLVVQLDVCICYICCLEVLIDVDLVILLGSKNMLSDFVWLCESGMVDVVLQIYWQGVLVMGICGGYQMLGDIIVDEVELGLGMQLGLGLFNMIICFVQDKIMMQVNVIMLGELFSWLVVVVGLLVCGYEIYMGEMVLQEGCCMVMMLQKNGCFVVDGVVIVDGLVFGIYFYGLFDSDVFICVVVNGLWV